MDRRDFRWPDGSKLALSVVVNVEEGAEQNIRDGDRGPEPVDELSVHVAKPIRMHGNESNYQYGVKAGFPRVLKLLDRYAVRATWTAAALALERAPQIAEAIRRRGDEPCCHGWRWAHQYWMKEDAERDFIRRGLSSIEQTCGRRPVGWLSRYLHTDNTRRLLSEEGVLYHMDDYSDDFPFWDVVETAAGPRAMLVMPYALDSNDMKMWIAPSLTPRDWAQYAIDSFDQLRREAEEEGARFMSLGLHLRIIGRPGRIGALERFLAHIAKSGDAWIATREEIARAFAAACPPPKEAVS
ncbi:MAG: polysaccharide deacetylase family protein [Parvularculaceae bacterium]|nr:polysaccharide deacetylase family protein [Parvularculaceae bacterium]